MRRLPVGLLLSGALHAGLLLGVVAALGGTAPSMLFVDLVHGVDPGGDGASGGGASGERPPGAAESGAPRASAPPRASASPTAHERSGESVAQPTLARASRPTPPVAPPAPSVAPPEPKAALAVPFVLPEPAPVADLAPSPARPADGAPAAPASAMPDATTSQASGPAATWPTATSSGDGVGAGTTRPGISAGDAPGMAGGQGGSGGGGGRGAGLGAGRGSALALAVPGDGGGEAAEYDGYRALVRARVHELLKYPTVARRRGVTGQVEILIDIAPTGVIGVAALMASSSHRLLDEAALEAVRAVGRVPFPPGVRPRPLKMRLPVIFVLR